MDLPRSLVKEFAKSMIGEQTSSNPTTNFYGTISEQDGTKYVQLDGSDVLTPISQVIDAEQGDRVLVSLENHKATVIGNFSYPPSARETKAAKELASEASGEVSALRGYIETLAAEVITTEYLEANYTKTEELVATYATIESLKVINASIENLETTKLSADTADLKYATIENLEAAEASIDYLESVKMSVDEADIRYASIQDLEAVNADIDSLQADKLSAEDADIRYATIESLNAVNAVIENLDAVYATIEELEAANANIDNLTVGVGNIKTLMFGSATGTSISTEFSNAVASMIGDGYIKNAMIEDLSFEKITGIDINTTKLTIHSEDGKSKWADNTIQISDAERIRVQIGKDASNDYNMYIWDSDGNLMFDALGLTDKGIQREIIRNDMVAQNASIDASKLDIETLFNVINEDGTHTLNSTKVYFDSEQQTLDLVFNSMRTDLDSAEDNIFSALTQISAVNGKISTLVQEMDTLDGEFTATKTLAEQTADKFTWLVSSGTGSTNFTLTDRVAELVADQINLSGLVTFSGLDSNAQEKINSAVVSTTVYYALGTSETVPPTTGWSATAPAWEDGKYMWQKTTVLYADGTDYTSDPTCITGATGQTGEPGAKGDKGDKGEMGAQGPQGAPGEKGDKGETGATGPQGPAGEKGDKGDTGATGPKGETGDAGVGISSITEYYAVSSSNSTAPTSWNTSVPTMTTTNKYLWNYERITYTNNTASDSAKRVIGVYGDKGATGAKGEKGDTGSMGATGPKGDTGDTGNGIQSITNYYLVSASSSGVTTSTGGWTTTMQSTSTSKRYLWNYEKIAYTNGTTVNTTPVIIGTHGATGSTGPKGDKGDTGKTGSTGPQGPAGEDGRGVKTTAITYQKSTSGTTIPTGTWSSTIPSVAAGEYLWTKTVLTYTDDTTSTAYSVGMMGATGPKGQTGATGSAGKGVKSTVITYQSSTSGTTAPTGTWSSSIPSVAAGSFLWTRTVITYTDNTTSTSYSVGKMGNTGATGATGKGVSAIVAEFYLSTSSTALSGGSWSTATPTWINGKYVWRRDKVTWTDGTTTYTTAVLDNALTDALRRSYEADQAIANWCYNNDRTVINGAKIYTGSITADKINVSSLQAISAKIGGFTIGSNYIANGTTSLAGAANSVYLGTNGISCGKAFKALPTGQVDMTNVNISGGALDIRGNAQGNPDWKGFVKILDGVMLVGYDATAQGGPVNNCLRFDDLGIQFYDPMGLGDPMYLEYESIRRLNNIYPVGSIYISTNSVDPSTLFGGTWKKIEGKFLLGSSSSYALGASGGSANAVVVSHTHAQVAHTHTVGKNSHSHKYGYYTDRAAKGTARNTPGSTGASGTYNTTSDTHTHSVNGGATTTGAASGGVAGTGKNMPPYLVVNIWERTA